MKTGSSVLRFSAPEFLNLDIGVTATFAVVADGGSTIQILEVDESDGFGSEAVAPWGRPPGLRPTPPSAFFEHGDASRTMGSGAEVASAPPDLCSEPLGQDTTGL